MRNRRISSLLLAASMLISLVVPVSAADSVYLVTNNTVSEANKEAFKTATGVDSYELTSETVTVTDNLSGGSIETSNAGTLFDGMWNRNGTWSEWLSNFDVTIDLGGKTDLSKFVFWNVPMRSAINVSKDTFLAGGSSTTDFSDNTYIQEKIKYTVQVSTDGDNWTKLADDKAATYTADNAVYEMNGETVLNVMFKESIDCDVKNVQYIRFAATKGQYQVRISEIAAIGTGFKVAGAIDPETSMVVLSQNTFAVDNITRIKAITNQDIYAYPQKGYVPTVAYASDGFTENTAADAQYGPNKLKDGQISDQTFSKWGGVGETWNLTIDLGGKQSVEQVIMWSNADGSDKSKSASTWEDWASTHDYEWMTVSTSLDGETYTPQITEQAPVDGTEATTWFDSSNRVFHAQVAKFASAVSARYVKLTVKEKAGDYQFRTAEVAVLGDVTAKPVREVLSANAISDDIRTYLETAVNCDLDTTVAYNTTKMTVTDPLGGAKATDSENLQNGKLSERNVCLGGWANGTGYINVDLGAVQKVSNVFIWNCVADKGSAGALNGAAKSDYTSPSGGSTYLKSLKVSTSTDGVNWTDGAVVATGERKESEVWFTKDNQNVVWSYQYDLAEATDARYLKIEAPFAYHMDLSEVVVLGEKTSGISRTLISGNGYGSADNNIKSTYAKLGVDVTETENTAIKFTEAVGNDMSKINQGVLAVPGVNGGDNLIWSTPWGTKTLVITADLGKSYMVSGADAECFYENENQTFSKVKVEVSENNTDFTTVVEEKNLVENANMYVTWSAAEAEGEYQKEGLSINDFTPVKARYVRLTLTGGRYQLVPNEVLIFGSEMPSATTPVFVDKSGVSYTEGLGGEGLFAKTTFAGGEGTLVVGWYDSDMKNLKKVWTKTGSGEVSIDLSDEEATFYSSTDVMRAFAFDSIDGLESLSDTFGEVDLGK